MVNWEDRQSGGSGRRERAADTLPDAIDRHAVELAGPLREFRRC
jgi:hypothetical protein